MNRIKKLSHHFLTLTLLVGALLFGCDSDNPVETIKLVSSSGRVFGEIVLSNNGNMKIENRIGGIILSGVSSRDTIDYFLYRMVKAETVAKAQGRMNEIVLVSEGKDDTMNCSISAPQNSEYYEFYSSLSLDVPYKMPCIVKSPNLGVTASYLDTTLTILNSNGTIDVIKHSGSCDVKTSAGEISIEMMVPGNGFCRSYTSTGDIILKLPTNTSATIYAKTSAGSITYSNLTISDLVESDGLLTGKLGSANGEINLETESGNIEIIGFD